MMILIAITEMLNSFFNVKLTLKGIPLTLESDCWIDVKFPEPVPIAPVYDETKFEDASNG